MNLVNWKNLVYNHALKLLLIVGAILRLVFLPSAFYGPTGELFRDLIVLYNFIFLHHWPLLGPSSSLGGFSFGPAYYYLLAPFYWLFHYSPAGIILASALFSILSIWLVYILLVKWFGNKDLALIGALLLTFSVYDIQNASYISNPTLMPFFILWFLYCLTHLLEASVKWKYVLGLAISLAIATQLHATALVVLPVVLINLLLTKKLVLKFKFWLVLIVISVFAWLPYLIFEFSHHFSNFTDLLTLGKKDFSFVTLGKNIISIAEFFSRTIIYQNGFYNFAHLHPTVYYFFMPFYTIVPLGLWLFWRNRKQAVQFIRLKISGAGGRLLALWSIVAGIIFLLFRLPIQHFYFLVVWPLPILLLTWLLGWKKRNFKFLYAYGLGAFIGLQILQLIFFYPFIRHPEFSQ